MQRVFDHVVVFLLGRWGLLLVLCLLGLVAFLRLLSLFNDPG